MDVSRYEFGCQKSLHQGLQYARSLGHQLLEVEHVALALLRAEAITFKNKVSDRLMRHIENHLARLPRIYGNIKIDFGRRLDAALDAAEEAVGGNSTNKGMVNEKILWAALCKQSTVLQTFLAKMAQEDDTPLGSGGDGNIENSAKPAATSRVSEPKQEASSKAKADTPGSKAQDKFDKDLRQFTIDLSAQAERGDLDPVIGRDSEVRRILEILGRKKKNNPLLIGEPGVGKSAVAEAIAIRIAEGSVPESMRGKRILSLDLGAMLAGAKFRGEFEDRMKNLLKALEALDGQVILFIDEIHMLVGAGNQEGGADAANLLKPALARGELHCLGATTIDEYRKHIEKDAALERRFQPLYVEEPNKSTAIAIMRGLKSRYEIHHGVQIDDEALVAAVDLSVQYIAARRLPDKAIDLMDEAASRLRLQVDSMPAVLDELRAQIQQIEIERKAIGKGPQQRAVLSTLDARLEKVKSEHQQIEEIWRRHQALLERMKGAEKKRQELSTLYENAKSQGDFDFAARLQYAELPKLETELTEVRAALVAAQKQHSFLRQVVGAREIAEVVANWTRVPVSRLLESDNQKLLEMERRLGQRVFGQHEAIKKISRAVKRARVGVHDPNRPLGVFLFMGPTGVGKTETSKALALELFSDEKKMVRIDMSEYIEQHNVARLVGSPPGYVGYGDGGELTEAVRHKPYSVVLLDEIEKAHPRVLDILLQTFEDGRLTDGKGRLVDFRNTLIIMTSNLTLDMSIDPEGASEQEVRNALARELRPEFVNRIDEIIVFKRLGRKHLENLIDRLLVDLNERLKDRQFRIALGPALRAGLIALGAPGTFGGRAVRRAFQTLVVDAVSDRVLTLPGLAIGAWTVELDEDGGYQWREQFLTHHYLPPAK